MEVNHEVIFNHPKQASIPPELTPNHRFCTESWNGLARLMIPQNTHPSIIKALTVENLRETQMSEYFSLMNHFIKFKGMAAHMIWL